LSSYAINNYDKWKNEYFDGQNVYHPRWNQQSRNWKNLLWMPMNIYPIYLFSDANSNQFGKDDFAERLINFFRSLSGSQYEGIDGILKLK